MNSDDEKLRKFFNKFKEDITIDSGVERKVMNMVKQRERAVHRRKVLMGAIGLAVAGFLVISSAIPVFGKSGTLPEVITGISLQREAKSFVGSINTNSEVADKLNQEDLSPTDSVILAALVEQTNVSADKIIQMRKDGLGWGEILSTLGVSVNNVKETLSEAAKSVSNTEAQQSDKKTNANTTPDSENEEEENEEKQENTNNALVIKGAIENISENTITVNGVAVSITDKTPIKYHGKNLTADKLSAGDEVLIKGMKPGDNIEAMSITVIKTNNGNTQENNEDEEDESPEEEDQSKNSKSKITTFNGTVEVVNIDSGTLTLKGLNKTFKVSPDTVIIYHGKALPFNSINTGDSVNIICTVGADNSINVEKIIITKKSGNSSGNENKGNGNGGSSKNKGNSGKNKGKGKP